MKGLLSVVTTTGLILGSVLAIGSVVGLTLPESHQEARSARFAAPPTKVFGVITDFSAYPSWRSDVTRVELLPDDGKGVRFTEYSNERPEPIRYRVEEMEAPTRVKVMVDDDSLPFAGTWTYVLQPYEGGTSITITEDGTISNPLFRLVAKLLFSPTDAMDRYLHDLSSVEGLGGRR